ncbi:MAG: hypothetical protein P0107_04925, partial [Nitrosomonas sp.]|nr:hypothetical protein [Nitrosomonas sp.]
SFSGLCYGIIRVTGFTRLANSAAGLLFPAGYAMLSILGLEMATGSFSVMPMGLFLVDLDWVA